MTDKNNLWESYAACWSAEPGTRAEGLAETVSADVAYRDPTMEVSGRDELAAYMTGFTGMFPGHRFRIDEVLTHHDRSLARWTQVGTDGETFMTGVSTARHHEGLLADVTGFFLPA